VWQASFLGHYCVYYQTTYHNDLLLFVSLVVVPVISVPMEGSTVLINENSSTTIDCTATGFPLPIVGWERVDGSGLSTRLSMTNPVTNETITSVFLVVTGVSREDSGAYRCSAVSDVGSDNSTVNLVVQCK